MESFVWMTAARHLAGMGDTFWKTCIKGRNKIVT